MKRSFAWCIALGFTALLAACGSEGGSGATTGAAPTTSAATTMAATTAATTAASTTTSATTTDAPSASGSASAAPSGTGSAGSPAASGSAAAGAKKFDCGEKGQKPCPMQGWMKSVMGSAVASGDGERLSKALSAVAAKPVAGFGNWSAIAAAGAAKAASGDIDGAKQACKQCHDAYKFKYQTTMRDRPW